MSLTIQLRVPDDVADAWREQADAAGVTLSAWIRARCESPVDESGPLKALKPREKPLPHIKASIQTGLATPGKPVAASGIQFKDLCPRCINKIRPIPIGIAHLIERAEVGIHASIVAMAEANELLRLHVRHKAD